MTTGAPDYSRNVILYGWDGSVLRKIKVDATGQLFAKLRGVDGGGVDRDIRVDTTGQLYAMLRALYGVTQKDIQCDTNGNLTLNLKAQDLAEIINRPKYGAAHNATYDGTLTTTTETTLFTVTGKGIIYSGQVIVKDTNATHTQFDRAKLYIDDWYIGGAYFYQYALNNFTIPGTSSWWIRKYDIIANRVAICVLPGITFETNCSFHYTPYEVSTVTVSAGLIYALL